MVIALSRISSNDEGIVKNVAQPRSAQIPLTFLSDSTLASRDSMWIKGLVIEKYAEKTRFLFKV